MTAFDNSSEVIDFLEVSDCLFKECLWSTPFLFFTKFADAFKTF